MDKTISYVNYGLFFLLLKITFTVPFPDNMFPNKDAPKVPNNILRNPPFYSFVSLFYCLVTPFNKIFKSSKA